MGNLKRYIIVSIAIVVGVIAWLLEPIESETHTRQFCAYGRIYVEFQQGNKIWGTTFVDEDGKPIKCTENSLPKSTAILNRSII